ncbi:MAG: polyprenyl synthetase family protein [Deferribacteraceae bacterium]|jgi:geranylgeranyl diphosphate synthase type II|nr:polyprenyl synthetase family protein [Deferribacteraceae bacterium]
MIFSLSDYLSTVNRLVNEWTANNFIVSDSHPSKKLYDSMLYSLNAGGKKVRPTLLIMCYNLFRNLFTNILHPALPYAAAVEMVHTYSLIHDDLPGIDNDNLRRGKPTNHIVYGEATAILAGDGLLTKAFEIFLNSSLHNNIPINISCEAAFELAKAIGPDGMVGGQYADINNSSEKPDRELTDFIHIHKTADFISVCAKIGAILAEAGRDDITRLELYGQKIGLAFQITDDILDITSTTSEMGKTHGSDEKNNKLTYPKAYGMEFSMEKAEKLTEEAVSLLSVYDENADPLRSLATFIIRRNG